MKTWIAALLLVLLVVPGAGLAEEVEDTGGWLSALTPKALEALTDDTGQIGKGRIELLNRGRASAGPSGAWYSESQSAIWSAGFYAKLATDPNVNTPGLDQLAAVTAWARDSGLPISDPYLLVEPQWVDYTEDAGTVLANGVGVLIADHIVAEATYEWVDGGTIDGGHGAQTVSSGWDLWFGLRWDF